MPEIAFDYNDLKPKVEAALREGFPSAGIFLSKGYNGRVHVKIVSDLFNNMSSAERQTYVYDLLNAKLSGEAQGVSLVSAYSADEL